MKHRITTLATVVAAALAGGDALAKKPDNPGKPDRSTFGKARAPLVRPDDGADENAKGRIDVQRRKNGSDLRVKGQRLDAGLAVDVVIETLGDDPGTLDTMETDFVLAREVLADGILTNDDGAVQIKLRTHKNDVLPLGAESLDELVGARVAVRTDSELGDGDDLLVGRVPAINGDLPKRVDVRDDLTPVEDAACEGRIRLRFRGKDVRSELRIDVRGLEPGAAVSFRMDDGAGSIVEFATDTADDDGEAGYRASTHHGQMLPFGAMTVFELSGRPLEVWVDAETVDPTPEIPDDPLVETGLCLTGTVPAAD